MGTLGANTLYLDDDRQIASDGAELPAAGGAGPAPVETSLLGYARCNTAGLIQHANATLASWLGAASAGSLKGRSLESFVHDTTAWQQWWRSTARAIVSFDLLNSDGQRKSVKIERSDSGADDHIDLWLAHDIEAAMISRIARLEAALTLTSGTVHDVNNVLTVLSGNLFLLTDGVRGNDKLYEQARRSRNAAERGATLLRELLTFSREVDSDTATISSGNHVFALEPLLTRAVGSDRELRILVDNDAGAVIASAAQFESALINLVINARDALGKEGKILIQVSNKTLDAEGAASLRLDAGEFVCIKVADNGSGIPEKYLQKVLQPLFTTKPNGRGSGLGLAMVRRFAEEHHGALQLDSIEGRGTQVRIWLPRTDQLAETTANMTLPLSTLPGGDERVLLVSRDSDVRASMQQILEALGYTVLTIDTLENVANDPAEAGAPEVVICERSEKAERAERNWLDSLRESGRAVPQIALLQAGSDPERVAPDADAYIFRPVAVLELARTVRRALEKK